MTNLSLWIILAFSSLYPSFCFSFSVSPKHSSYHRYIKIINPIRPSTQLNLFGDLSKVFEESGPLGKGITVGKVQIALQCKDRSGIFQELESAARTATSENQRILAQLANRVCLALLRKSDDWVAACSTKTWFSERDASRAESQFNDMSNREASKFEKDYIPDSDAQRGGGGPTLCVVSLLVELQGDQTKFDGAGFTLSGTRDVLTSIASDVMVDGGGCVNAVELFWTPSERSEVLSNQDLILDFPEMINL